MAHESFSEAWHHRYGTVPPADLPDLAPFLRHRSVRAYSDQPVPESLIAGLVAAAQSASTSSNLQMWSMVSVESPERRERLAELCGGQNQVKTAPWFIAFVADYDRVHRGIQQYGEGGSGIDTIEMFLVAVIDAALAAERMVVAAESVGLGVCYIGALRNDPEGVSQALNLPIGAFGTFGLCIGYPEETSTAEIKPRLPQAAVWHRDQYDPNADLSEFDGRMAEFYARQAMKNNTPWTQQIARRTDTKNLSGRERILAWLHAHGMALR